MKNCSEALFERFLSDNNISFQPIAVGADATPDYSVEIAGMEVVFEVKEIRGAQPWTATSKHTAIVGERIRQLINGSKRQIKIAARDGKPTVLLVFNHYDPFQLWGTEDFDFEQAMYGAYTLRIVRGKREIVDRFHGRGKSFQPQKNTSFSALGRLKRGQDAALTVTLFENLHATLPLDYGVLPPCFEVICFEMS